MRNTAVESGLPRFSDYTITSFQSAHLNVFISVSNVHMKVHKSQFEHAVIVVIVVVVIVAITGTIS